MRRRDKNIALIRAQQELSDVIAADTRTLMMKHQIKLCEKNETDARGHVLW